MNTLFVGLQHASSREVLSLEEILAEGASSHTSDRERRGPSSHSPEEVLSRNGYPAGTSDSSQIVKLTKQQIKTLQEAMYHSAESGHLGMIFLYSEVFLCLFVQCTNMDGDHDDIYMLEL